MPLLAYSVRVSNSNTVADNQAERVLATLVAIAVGLSLLAFITVMIGTAAGAGADDGFSQGAWPFVLMLPYFGLPLGFLLLLSLLILNGVRRARAARSDAD